MLKQIHDPSMILVTARPAPIGWVLALEIIIGALIVVIRALIVENDLITLQNLITIKCRSIYETVNRLGLGS